MTAGYYAKLGILSTIKDEDEDEEEGKGRSLKKLRSGVNSDEESEEDDDDFGSKRKKGKKQTSKDDVEAFLRVKWVCL